MAEYLVYNTDHWVDKFIKNNPSSLPGLDLTGFEIRYRKGDIIQTYEDGKCTKSPSPNSPFIIIKCYKQEVDNKYQESKIVARTQEALNAEFREREDEINSIVDVYMANFISANREIVLAEIKLEFIDQTEVTNRREYYFDLSQINIPENKVIEMTTTQFNNLVKSK